MHAAKVKVTLGRDVGHVDGNAALLAERVDFGRGDGVVDGGEHHGDGRVVEVGGEEVAVDVGDEVVGDVVGDPGTRPAVGVMTVTRASALRRARMRPAATLPPPTTRTRRLRTCQARRREPPGWMAGNSSVSVEAGAVGRDMEG